jgi:hypothetical protein
MAHAEVRVQDNAIDAIVAAAQQILIESAQPVRHGRQVTGTLQPASNCPAGATFSQPPLRKSVGAYPAASCSVCFAFRSGEKVCGEEVHEHSELGSEMPARRPQDPKGSGAIGVVVEHGDEYALTKLPAYGEVGQTGNTTPCSATRISGSSVLATAVLGSSVSMPAYSGRSGHRSSFLLVGNLWCRQA